MADGISKFVLTRNPLQWLAFGFGAGLIPYAPGTWGTLVGMLAYWFLFPLMAWLYLWFVLLAAVFGIVLCDYTVKQLNVHDHPGIVWDEMVGFWITMIAVPYDIRYLLLGFLLFRVFDIYKPWPIRWLDQSVRGGLGIMLDDVLAGIFACSLLHIINVSLNNV